VTFNSAPVNQGPATSEASFTENASNPPPMSLHDNIAFTDVDPNDHHTVKVVEDPGLMNGAHAAGILHATLLPDTTNGTGGLVHFDYEVSEAAVQDLTAGQQKIDAFDVQIDDGHGGISHHLVKLTIFGSDF